MRQGSDERIAVSAALASMLAALTLAPLVSGYAWTLVAAITVVAAMVAGIVARQLLRWWPAVVLAQALVLLFTLVVLFARSRVVDPVAAVGLLRDLVDAGLQVTREQAPPVEATQGVILLVAGSAGLIALLVDLLAATLRQPALAGLPLLAVYCVPAALLDGGLPWYYFTFAAAGFLLLLTADAGDRVRGWGRMLSAGRGGATESGTGGGRTVGVVTLLLAVALPTLVPGLGNQILGGSGEGDGTGGNGRTITRINPIVDLRRDLTSPQDTPLLDYTTGDRSPGPLRIVTADVYDGTTWAPSTNPIPRSQRATERMPAAPGLAAGVETETVETSIRIGNLEETYLPLPYPAIDVRARGDWLYDAETLNVIGDRINTRNLNYGVTSLVVRPNAQQLAESRTPPPSVLARYQALPPDMPPVIGSTAAQVGGDGSDYQKAVRIQRWLRDPSLFTYSLDAPEPRSGNSGNAAIVDFLQQRRGYCVHFASAMAVMARTIGIPARVAIGFLPGERQADGSMQISANDAHAWPELYFEGVGWTRFEPTPRSDEPTTPPDWTEPPAGLLPEDPAETALPSAEPSASASAQPSAAPSRPVDEAAPGEEETSTGPGVPWRPMLVVLVVLVGLSAPRIASTLASRRRWNRATSVPTMAEAAWDDLRLGLSDLGVGWAASWTPRAVERRLADDYRLGPDERAALGRLTAEVEGARYAPPTDDLGRSADERAADAAAVTAAVAATRPGLDRWRARLWPRSGVDLLSRLWPWMTTTADQRAADVRGLRGRAWTRIGRVSGRSSGRGGTGDGGSAYGRPDGSGPGAPGGSGPGSPAGSGQDDRVGSRR